MVHRGSRIGKALLGVALASWALGCGAPKPDAVSTAVRAIERRPNLVLIVADDMSPDTGAYGDPFAWTPNLDRLAAEGVRFSHAYSVSGVCAPSRSALWTGMYPTTIGTHHMRSWGVPPPQVHPVSELLRAAGYYTTNSSKVDTNTSAYLATERAAPQPRGTDIQRAVLGPPLGAWDESGRDAHWRHRPDPGQPFFAVFDLFVTHESRVRAPTEAFEAAVSAVPPERRHDPAVARLPPYYPDADEVRRDWARYYDLVSAADLEVGRLLAELEEDGVAADTVVMFFGDHGRGLPRAKRWLYDSGIRVPLLVRWPEHLAPGTVDEELVSFVDFAPTLLALAGVEVPGHLPGRVFLGERQEPERDFVFAARDRMDETDDRIRAVRDRRFKYLRNFEPEKAYSQPIAYADAMPTMQVWRRWAAEGRLDPIQQLFLSARKPIEELYDTRADPHEVHNLAGDPEHQDRLAAMRGALDDWIVRTGDLGGIGEPEQIERMRGAAIDLATRAPQAKVEKLGGGRARVTLSSETPGAAIVYSLEDGPDVSWRLYTSPLEIAAPYRLRLQAGRLGHYDSDEVVIESAG